MLWAIGTYPVEQDDNDIEMIIFILINSNDRDPDSQVIFEKNKYYAISRKIIPEDYCSIKRPKMTVATSTHVAINRIINRQFNSNNYTNNSQISTTSPNSTRSKLLVTHQSISKDTEKNLENAI
ncbi:617_t:CDS:2, partial [Scutellospora calospora]